MIFLAEEALFMRSFLLPGIHLALYLCHPNISNVLYNVFLMYYALYNVVFVSPCQFSQYKEMHLSATVEISEYKSNLD